MEYHPHVLSDSRPSPASPKSRTRRAIAALAGLSALAATAPAFGYGQSTVIFYTHDAEGNPGWVIDSHETPIGASHGFCSEDLESKLVSTPLKEVLAGFRSDSLNTEADIFTLDPTAHVTNMVKLAEQELDSDPSGIKWIDATSNTVHGAVEITLPPAVALPFPNEDYPIIQIPGAPPPESQMMLWPDSFAGYAPNKLAGEAAMPQGEGSVKGVRIYDHGVCSATQQLEPLYEKIQNAVWDGFAAEVNKSSGDATQYYSAAVTLLHHPAGTPTDLLIDGFQLGVHLHATMPWYVTNFETTGYMTAQLYLEDGHLRARHFLPPQINPDSTGPVITEGDVTKMTEDMFNQVLDEIGKQADSQQTQAVLSGTELSEGFAKCDPGKVDPCAEAAKMFAEVVASGVPTVKYNTGVILDEDQLKKSVQDPDLWTCAEKPDATFECRMFVPAKRLNVYPDELELVWFDGPEEDNPAYAAWVAANSPFAPKDAKDQICQPRPNPYTIDHFTRPYAMSFQNKRYQAAP